jgi:hypothetical protein
MTESEIQAILRNHGEQLANHQELLSALAELVHIVRAAQEAHQQVFESLQRAVADKMGGEPPAEPRPGPVH